MQNRCWEEEILVVVSKAEEASLHDFCCKVADQYGYNISVFVVDNSDPDTALSDLELLTSRNHFELVVLGAELDWAIKGALRQVVKEAGLNTSTRVLVTRGQDDISEVWQVLASKALHRRSPSPA
ncbi:hypothetical protein WJX75_005130 [Coccomyxa subellipsoidea]|uniref:Response regulatory domain-containing protein n=1 Tax=Coccomyxa subellipsoidea TaxID=248742 RepID=A0ABR2YW21_9CHLO